MGKSGGTCRLMMQGISLCDHVTERDATGELALLGGECGAPRANQDSVCLLSNRGPHSKPRLVCLLWGKAEVRVAHYPLGTQNKLLLIVYFGKAEVHVAQ